MEFSIKAGSSAKQTDIAKLRSGCIAVGVFEGGKLTEAAQNLDKASQHYISGIIKRGDMDGKAASTLVLHDVPNLGCERVLLLGLGKAAELDAKQYRDCARALIRGLKATGAKEATVFMTDIPVKGKDAAWCLSTCVQIAYESNYRFDQLKSKPAADKTTLKKIQFGQMHGKPSAALETALYQAVALSKGIEFTKNLGNLPGNICTPTYLAQQAISLGKKHRSVKTSVLEEKDMQKLGMGSLLSVTRGSVEPAKLITMQYHGADKKQKPVVLVGKGITFDTGGISLKPGAEMDEMKYDMCGAASVLGTMQAIAEMGLKLNVVGIIPTCENMPSGNATKPGDIVTSMSGQTIEILNTDAEGRLILCDALTYAAKFDPEIVIDIATLTGACIIALGHVASGLFSNDDKLAQDLLKAADQSQDKAWQMPLWEDYQPQLDSNFADMQNIGGRAGGSITAACFLARFTKDYRWAHLDIAGTAWKSGKDKGATGRPVPLLAQYLINRTGSK